MREKSELEALGQALKVRLQSDGQVDEVTQARELRRSGFSEIESMFIIAKGFEVRLNVAKSAVLRADFLDGRS